MKYRKTDQWEVKGLVSKEYNEDDEEFRLFIAADDIIDAQKAWCELAEEHGTDCKLQEVRWTRRIIIVEKRSIRPQTDDSSTGGM